MILTKGKTKEVDLDQLLYLKIKAGKLNEVLLIVTTNRKIRHLKRELISASPNEVATGINLETIGSYSIRVLSGSDGQNKLVSEEAAIVLLKQCFQETEQKYFSNYKGEIPFGTLERIKNVISEYKRNGITPSMLMNESEQLSGTDNYKAEDISNIYKKYQNKLSEFGVSEIGDVYSELSKLNEIDFREKFVNEYPDVNLVIINGFDEFSRPEIEIINSTASLKNVELYIYFDYAKYNPAIFSHLDKCYNKLTEIGFRAIKDQSVGIFPKFLNEVRDNLFKSRRVKKSTQFKQQIKDITAFTRENEIELIARQIKKLIIEERISPNQICVACYLIKSYSPIVRDRFSLYNIPFNLTDRFSLSTSPLVIILINLLEVIERDFYYKNLFRALSNEIIDITNIDLNNLLKASVELKVVSGLKNWKERLNDAIIESTYGDETRSEFKRYNVDYRKALDDIDSIYSLLKPFSKRMNIAEFSNNLNELVVKLRLHKKLLNGHEGSIEQEVKAITTFLKSSEELFNLLQLEYGSEKQFPLKFFLSELRTIASFSRYNIKEKPGYGVLVTTLNEIRGLQFDHLFIAGLTDGDFPTRYSPEIFFSGSFVRAELQHQTEERYHFYQALCSWRKRLYFSHPQTDGRKELVESNFLIDFKNTFDVSEITAKDFEDTVFSKNELLEYVGKSVSRGSKNLNMPENADLNLDEIKNANKINEIRLKDETIESPFTGVLTDNLNTELQEELSKLKYKQYSVTQLESYAKCPYKYFAERVLHLNTLEEPTEEMEAFELGSLLHIILYRFYIELAEKNIVLQSASEKIFTKAENMLFNIANDIISNLKLNSALTFYEKEKILGIGGDKRNSILYKFLIEERTKVEGFLPKYFETTFGEVDDTSDERVLNNEEFFAGKVKVRGKIDRVDINEEEGTVKIIDYKLSGKTPTQNDFLSGLSLQLPLYLFAAKQLINAQMKKDYEPFGSEIYSLKFNSKEFGPKLVKMGRAQTNEKDRMAQMAEEMINVCIESINKYVDEIASGKFNLSELEDRENKVCRFCNFRSICRIQEVN
ncbi:MAG: exodeoxyribonuclease V subunit gamma [Ignavibacterium sp.]|nr:MAG: exodeoxyribonuclease V subunit gamma [Ignavibacterium sp.]